MVYPVNALANGENILVKTVSFPVNINYEQCNTVTENNRLCYDYQMFSLKGIIYFPLTYYNCNLTGLTLELDENRILVKKADISSPMLYKSERLGEETFKDSFLVMQSPVSVNINGMDYDDENYPILFYNDVIYIPLTWNMVNDILDWDYTFDEKGVEIYTESYYYSSSGDSSVEITENYISANVMPGKTYWSKNGVRVYAETTHIDRLGPNGWNMSITKDGVEKIVPGFTGHFQKMGPLFTVDEDYIYTVHYEENYEKWGPCKISIETGEVIYTNFAS